MARHLSSSDDDTASSGSKFVLNCNDITTSHPTSAGWLDHVSALRIIPKHKALAMPDKKILEALFHNRKRVVVKVANDTQTLNTEWEVYQHLASLKLKGILKYHCYFTCNDTLTRIITDQTTVCNGPGTNTQVLVMDYIDAPSMKYYEWKSIDALRSCIKQVVMTMVEGFLACQFVHGDLHLDNVLIKSTSSRMIRYPIANIEVPVYGVCTKIMDMESASTGKHPVLYVCKDIKKFMNKMLSDLAHIVDTAIITRMFLMLREWEENKSIRHPRELLQLFPMIDSINFLQTGGRPTTPPKRRSAIGKKGRANWV